MVVGVVGLGLIGGSAAKAFKAAGATVLAFDINEPIVGYAQLDGVVDGDCGVYTTGVLPFVISSVVVFAFTKPVLA